MATLASKAVRAQVLEALKAAEKLAEQERERCKDVSVYIDTVTGTMVDNTTYHGPASETLMLIRQAIERLEGGKPNKDG